MLCRCLVRPGGPGSPGAAWQGAACPHHGPGPTYPHPAASCRGGSSSLLEVCPSPFPRLRRGAWDQGQCGGRGSSSTARRSHSSAEKVPRAQSPRAVPTRCRCRHSSGLRHSPTRPCCLPGGHGKPLPDAPGRGRDRDGEAGGPELGSCFRPPATEESEAALGQIPDADWPPLSAPLASLLPSF